MLHHFADVMDREGGYWTIIPNRERYAYRIREVAEADAQITIVTIGKEDENWRRVFSLPNLEELTLHEPSAEQLLGVGELRHVKRLRITHARPKTLAFIASMEGLEELVLEYVSGFTDLSPLRTLRRLRAVHLENLRGVSSFGGLHGLGELRYLAIYGTLDWKQPIFDFSFLGGLPHLEVLAFWQVVTGAPYPAMLPDLSLRRLKRLRVHRTVLATEEYALLEEGLSGVEGAAWGPFESETRGRVELPRDDVRAHVPVDVLRLNHPDVLVHHDGRRSVPDPARSHFVFTGKGAGSVRCLSATAEGRCVEFAARYRELRSNARALIGGR